MTPRFKALTLLVVLLNPVMSFAQGLVTIQNYTADFRNEQPLTFSATSHGGYDNLRYKQIGPLDQNIESWYVQGGLGAAYTKADPTTPLSFNLDTSVLHYVDGVPRFGDTFYNARGSFNFEHRFTERLRMSNNFGAPLCWVGKS